jgi:hypothetical protein
MGPARRLLDGPEPRYTAGRTGFSEPPGAVKKLNPALADGGKRGRYCTLEYIHHTITARPD